jgi:hypothetical protein
VICSLATSLPARARDDALRRGRGEPGVNQKFSQCFVNPITGRVHSPIRSSR